MLDTKLLNSKNLDTKELALIHARMGHVFLSKLTHLDHISISAKTSNDFACDTCQLAKFHRFPFPISKSIAHKPFDLVHVDLWGPYKVAYTSGAYYFLTLLDDCTRHTWVYLLHNKQQVPHHIQNFNAYVQNQFDTTIKCVRSDNGTEIFQALCSSILHQNGILHQRSVPRTPQQNGRVERKHRHVLNVDGALLFQASLPTKFWGECALAAAHLINRTPSKLLVGKMPYEVLYHQKPSYEHIKVLSTLCFTKIK